MWFPACNVRALQFGGLRAGPRVWGAGPRAREVSYSALEPSSALAKLVASGSVGSGSCRYQSFVVRSS